MKFSHSSVLLIRTSFAEFCWVPLPFFCACVDCTEFYWVSLIDFTEFCWLKRPLYCTCEDDIELFSGFTGFDRVFLRFITRFLVLCRMSRSCWSFSRVSATTPASKWTAASPKTTRPRTTRTGARTPTSARTTTPTPTRPPKRTARWPSCRRWCPWLRPVSAARPKPSSPRSFSSFSLKILLDFSRFYSIPFDSSLKLLI